ncbi:hypothetical protein E2C01_040513 [Portunus trituberculatus]|uniref:Uncharacterized protein n=1 Tax=Portunus trituberculatus TaxID=210409 RepID=A0A5B7FN81_PORTR|nr:hypothetical protein [Portunus trituberculatus]
MSLLALASTNKNSKTPCSALEAAPAHLAKTWSVQEAMSATEPHNFSICANSRKETEIAGLLRRSFALTSPLQFLTLALATAKRVREIQALSTQVAVQGHDMVLSYLPDFVAKIKTPSNPLPREFVLTSLSEAVCSNDDERLLCPVCALQWYLHRTWSPSRPWHLFLLVRNPIRPLSKMAISYFLQQLILAAHEDFPDHLEPILNVRAYDVQSVATSLLWSINKAVADIMAVACW